MNASLRPPARRGSIRKDERAEMGISTMIVFIAGVLVAAIAAAILIDTGVVLQEKSQRTGDEVTKAVTSNLMIQTATGTRPDTATTELTELQIAVMLAPGSAKMDLSQLTIQVTTGQSTNVLAYANAPPAATTFNTTAYRDADGSHTPDFPGMNAGDLILVNIDLDGMGIAMAPRSDMTVTLLPETGTPIRTLLIAPASFGNDLVVELR